MLLYLPVLVKPISTGSKRRNTEQPDAELVTNCVASMLKQQTGENKVKALPFRSKFLRTDGDGTTADAHRYTLVARRLRGGLAPALTHAWGEPVD